MIDDTNFFLMNPSSVIMTGEQTIHNDISTGLLENEQTHCIIERTRQQHHSEQTKPDCNMTSSNEILNFGPESYQTPLRNAMRNYTLSLDPPPPPAPRKMNYVYEAGAINRKRQRTVIPILIPSKPLSSSRTSSPLFQLLPRSKRVYDSPPYFSSNITLLHIPVDNNLPRQKVKVSESKNCNKTRRTSVESNTKLDTLQPRTLHCSLAPHFGNKFECVKRHSSSSAMSA